MNFDSMLVEFSMLLQVMYLRDVRNPSPEAVPPRGMLALIILDHLIRLLLRNYFRAKIFRLKPYSVRV